MLQPEVEAARQKAGVLATAEVDLAEVGAKPKDPGENLVAGQILDLRGRVAGGVERADQRAHAGAGNGVHGDVVFVEPPQDADFA